MIPALKRLSGYSVLSGIVLLFGFLRELVVAAQFGLSAELDTFVAVLAFYAFFGIQIGYALESAFVSMVAANAGVSNVRDILAASLFTLTIANLAIVGIVWFFKAPFLAAVFTGFTEDQRLLGEQLITVLLLAIIFANSAGLMRGALYVLEEFSLGFVAGALISIISITVIWLVAEQLGVYSLALGYGLGNAVVFVLFGMRLRKKGIFHNQVTISSGQKTLFLWRAASIILIAEALFQAYSVTERSLASTLSPGTISSFYYATALVNIFTVLVVTPLTKSIFPRMTRLFSSDRREGFRLVKRYGYTFLAIGCVIAAGLSFFAVPLVEIAYMRGEFSADDAVRTGELLSVLAFVLPFASIDRLIRFTFYSMTDYVTPIIGQTVKWGVFIVLGSYLTLTFGIKGLVTAVVISASAATMLMMIMLMARSQHG